MENCCKRRALLINRHTVRVVGLVLMFDWVLRSHGFDLIVSGYPRWYGRWRVFFGVIFSTLFFQLLVSFC